MMACLYAPSFSKKEKEEKSTKMKRIAGNIGGRRKNAGCDWVAIQTSNEDALQFPLFAKRNKLK